MYDFLLLISNSVGMIGVIIILIAYFLISAGYWSSESFLFQALNFFGAWLILFSLYFHWNLSSVVIEVAWVAISAYGMYRAISPNRKKRAVKK